MIVVVRSACMVSWQSGLEPEFKVVFAVGGNGRMRNEDFDVLGFEFFHILTSFCEFLRVFASFYEFLRVFMSF